MKITSVTETSKIGVAMKIRCSQRMNKKLACSFIDAANFYAEKLGLSDISDKISVDIFYRKFDDRGECSCSVYTNAPRTFNIILDSETKWVDPLQTLAHEMVHVKQYARGELQCTTKTSKWKGKLWRKKSDQMDDYYDSPWEIEAFGREEGLYLRYLVEKNNG